MGARPGLAELCEAERENSELFWTTSFSLPNTLLEALGAGRLVAYLEEVDRRMPASYRVEPVDFATMFSPDTFIDSGPRFSARIPFMEIGEAGPLE
ncbi:hypothetical protein [Amaricoccus sp. W119]|uniref:hypothetical protein n=1 Tax=Amaricoccus sp. W119 TaxID=3391833 RepID=UPI0039A634CC